MKINIEHITINIILPQESAQEKPVAPIRRGHRTQEEIQLKLESARLKQIALLKHATRVQHKLRVADRLRALFGDDVANSVMAGGF
jgi:DNA polymerase II large subunit